MNENEFEHDGKTYVAQKTSSGINCKGCTFNRGFCDAPIDTPSCSAETRTDRENKIFIEKPNAN